MKYWPKKLIPEVKTHGGKTYLCRRIFEAAPRFYSKFLDGYMGGGSMTYNAPAGKLQGACETHWGRYNVKWQLKEQGPQLMAALMEIPYTEQSFQTYKRLDPRSVNAFDEAVRFIVVNRMSRGGLGQDFGWSERLRGGQPGDVNAWDNMVKRLGLLSDRLREVRLIHSPVYKTLVEIMNEMGWLIYLDPPYLQETRSTYGEYGVGEMTVYQHQNLVDLLPRIKGYVMVSHYPCELYDSLGWRTLDFDMPNHSGQGATKERRVERLYMNYKE